MNPIHPKTRPAAGFALVVTLTLMVLLTILAVGLLSLSAVSLRNASTSDAKAVAQANARLALMLAIGEIQNELGPDSRITAPSAILDSSPQTQAIEGVSHEHLTGVWNARKEAVGQTPDYAREPSFRRWLVSQAAATDTERLTFAKDGSLSEPVTMVEGSDDGREPVLAGRVPVGGGRLAWWVADENQKAFANPKDELERDENAPVANLLAGFATPGPHGVQSLAGFAGFPSNTEISDKAATFDSLGLAHPETRDSWLFHDVSPYPRSVLASVTNGSLRKDLSLYLERGDINWVQGWGRESQGRFPSGPLGPNGKIALSNPDDHDVLAWKTLHHWYSMHRQQLGDSASVPLRAMLNTLAPDPIRNAAWNNGVARLTPVMVRMQMLISFGANRRGQSDDYDLLMYSYPVITLWNPYNVPLVVDQWSTFLHTLPLEHTIHRNNIRHPITGGGSANGNYNWGWPHGNMTLRVGGATGPGITFAPGEAKMLTYTQSQSGGFHAHDMAERPPAWLPTRAGQQRDLGTINGRATDRISIATALATWDTSSTSFGGQNFQTTFDFRCEPRAVHSGHDNTFQRQMFSAQVAWRHEPSNPRVDFISKDNFPSVTLGALHNNPQPFLHLDVRLKALDEPRLPNKTWLHNIPFHPYVSATSTAKHGGRNGGVDAATTFFAHPYTIAFEQVNGSEGVFQSRPFIGASYRPGGQERVVAAPVPLTPLTSLGQLQNLPLLPIEALNWSGYYFQNNAIGNSFASPGLDPDSVRLRSFPFHLGQYFPWQGGDMAGRTYDGRDWFNNADYTIPGATAYIVDRSYVANQLLFDDYFFSSMAGQEGPVFGRYGSKRTLSKVVTDFYKGVSPLPVAAYRPYHPPGEDPATVASSLTGRMGASSEAHLRAASRLIVEGGFNINSTSVPAWTAVLSAANLKRPVDMPRDASLRKQQRANYVISRNPNPTTLNDSEASRWLGYRELTEKEIHQLAEAVVRQVKQRGPFRSLGEFVNRRLTRNTDMALYGALQAALEDSSVDINKDYRGAGKEIQQADIAAANYRFPQAALGSRYQGTPAYISQADLLTPIAPIIQARSDTFLIRSYGEARSPDGRRVLARAWCEAVIQRLPDYIDSAADAAEVAHDQLTSAANRRFGRHFKVVSFRWLPSITEA